MARRPRSAPVSDSKSLPRSKGKSDSLELFPDVQVAAVFSFLKDTRGILNWTVRDMAETLRISAAGAREVIPYLSMQGYVRGHGSEFETTTAGEAVSGSAPPHFLPKSVEDALAALTERIKQSNRDSHSAFLVKKAVAFGDFLLGGARVQAADVGVLLAPRGHADNSGGPVGQRARENEFLKKLRGRVTQFRLVAYAEWMEARTHRKLI
jgi:hypothetical protein